MDTTTPAPVPGQMTLEDAPGVELAAVARELDEATTLVAEGSALVSKAAMRLAYVAGAFERLSEDPAL